MAEEFTPERCWYAFEGYDLAIFSSMEILIRWLEAIDVHDGIYEIFLGDGSPVTAWAEGGSEPQFGKIFVEVGEYTDGSRFAFLARFNGVLKAVGHGRVYEASELREAAIAVKGYFGLDRW